MNLQAKLYSDSEPIEARAEAVVLLKQLKFPVCLLSLLVMCILMRLCKSIALSCMCCLLFSKNLSFLSTSQQVDNLKSNLLEKLEDCLLNLQNESTQVYIYISESSEQQNNFHLIPGASFKLGLAQLVWSVLRLSMRKFCNAMLLSL